MASGAVGAGRGVSRTPGATTRRELLRGLAGTSAALALGGSTGCARSGNRRSLRLGYVSPQTGALAAFGEADAFVIGGLQPLLEAGIESGGRRWPVEVLVKDSQSDPNRAGQAAAELILQDEVDLVLAASTPETTNPVADQCELNQTPCVSTVAPWQPWYFARGGTPERGFEWTYHFFWGLEDVIAVFTNLWDSLETNRTVGALFPNDADGNAWGDPERGLPPALAKAQFQLLDPGRYQNLSSDFSAQLAAFRGAGAEIVTGVVLPPDFKTFWTQARQQGYRPKAVSVGKALLFPAAIEALGELGAGLSTEVWWSPAHPFRSSLSGASAAEYAAQWQSATGKQWTQPLGFAHALFEVALDALRRAADPREPAAIRDALASTALDTLVGRVAWGSGPVPNVAKTPLVGGQWVAGSRFPYELRIVDNRSAPEIPVQGALAPLA